MDPKLKINKDTELARHSKEDLLRKKVEELFKKNEEMRKELEELKNMIK